LPFSFFREDEWVEMGEPRRLVQVQVAGKIKSEKNHDGHSDADRVIAPVPAVRPNWKAPDERYDYHYRENE
jgi:hypothetical protein